MLRRGRVALWRLLRWWDWNASRHLAWAPAWGTSLLLHAIAILLMALFFYVRSGSRTGDDSGAGFAAQLTEDLTSQYNGERAGDPFTRLQSDEPPSLAIDPAAPAVEDVSQPEILAIERFAPDLAGPEPPRVDNAKGPKRGAPSIRLHAEDITAPFSGRDAMARGKMVRREGGTVKSEKAVEDGLGWIARHQRPDGGWSMNYQGQCRDSGCRVEAALESDTGATGLALLPLLGAGHVHTVKSRFQPHVRQGLDWLINQQKPDGDLFVGGARMSYLYSHAIGTMALCEAYGLSHDPRLRQPAQRAVNFIAQAQNIETGGWRYVPGDTGDTSVFGWQMFALRSARLAGLKIPKITIQHCRRYLDLASPDGRVTYSYLPGGEPTPVMTAEALLARQYLGWPRDFPQLIKGAARVADDLKRSNERNVYYWYYATQMLHNMQNDAWKSWNLRVRDGLCSIQVQGDGCDRGSWDPLLPQPDRWGRAAGRLFVTSLSILTLEVYYRYLPLYRPSDYDPNRLDEAVPKVDPNPAAHVPSTARAQADKRK